MNFKAIMAISRSPEKFVELCLTFRDIDEKFYEVSQKYNEIKEQYDIIKQKRNDLLSRFKEFDY